MGLLIGYAFEEKGFSESAQCQEKSFIPLKKYSMLDKMNWKCFFLQNSVIFILISVDQHCNSMIEY